MVCWNVLHCGGVGLGTIRSTDSVRADQTMYSTSAAMLRVLSMTAANIIVLFKLDQRTYRPYLIVAHPLEVGRGTNLLGR